jgi:hypothetical protein
MSSGCLGVAGRDPRPHHDLERRRPQRPILHRHTPDDGLEQVNRRRGIALVEGELSHHHRRERVSRPLLEKILGLGEASLSAAQIGKSHDRQPAPGRPLESEALGRLGKRALGLGPAPVPGEHSAVMGPASEGDEVRSHPAAELLDLAAPLSRALVVAHSFASIQQEAERPAGRNDLLEFACQRRGCGFVEAAHSVHDLAFVHQRQALDREGEHLQRYDLEFAAELACPNCEYLRLCRIAVNGGDIAQERIEPAVLGAGLESFEDAGRALEPAIGNRTFAAQDEVVVGDPEREHRRAPHVSLPAAEKEGALARLQAGGDVLDPPRRPAQALQSVYRLVRLEFLLEDLPCGGPLPTGERDVALPDPFAPRRDLSYVRTVTARPRPLCPN